MPWKIRISDSAKEDVRDIKKWYKQQSLQAVENFIIELNADIESLKREDIEHKSVFANNKRLLLTKFPYTIYYSRNEKHGVVEITAVLHNRRDNDIIAKRFYE